MMDAHGSFCQEGWADLAEAVPDVVVLLDKNEDEEEKKEPGAKKKKMKKKIGANKRKRSSLQDGSAEQRSGGRVPTSRSFACSFSKQLLRENVNVRFYGVDYCGASRLGGSSSSSSISTQPSFASASFVGKHVVVVGLFDGFGAGVSVAHDAVAAFERMVTNACTLVSAVVVKERAGDDPSWFASSVARTVLLKLERAFGTKKYLVAGCSASVCVYDIRQRVVSTASVGDVRVLVLYDASRREADGSVFAHQPRKKRAENVGSSSTTRRRTRRTHCPNEVLWQNFVHSRKHAADADRHRDDSFRPDGLTRCLGYVAGKVSGMTAEPEVFSFDLRDDPDKDVIVAMSTHGLWQHGMFHTTEALKKLRYETKTSTLVDLFKTLEETPATNTKKTPEAIVIGGYNAAHSQHLPASSLLCLAIENTGNVDCA